MKSPFFAILIPLTSKNWYLLPFTLDSIVHQKYEQNIEVILLDGSLGKAVLGHLPFEHAKIISSDSENLASMLNLGLKNTEAEYFHVLMPGEYYISSDALSYMQSQIIHHHRPDLAYSFQRLRYHFGSPTIETNSLTKEAVKQGKTTLSLQAYWFRKETVDRLGGFQTSYQLLPGYDLMCRIVCSSHLRHKQIKRVLTDYEYRYIPAEVIWKQSVETARLLFKQFGLTRYLFIWAFKNCLRFFKFTWKMMGSSFWKKHATFE